MKEKQRASIHKSFANISDPIINKLDVLKHLLGNDKTAFIGPALFKDKQRYCMNFLSSYTCQAGKNKDLHFFIDISSLPRLIKEFKEELVTKTSLDITNKKEIKSLENSLLQLNISVASLKSWKDRGVLEPWSVLIKDTINRLNGYAPITLPIALDVAPK